MTDYAEPVVFAVKHLNNKIRAMSRSGGIFTALSDYILDLKGTVYGCVLNENLTANHIRATTREERDLMRGSKYVESKLGDTFRQVKFDVEEGKMVLFSGTSCQIAGLRAFLGKDYYNLLLVDILCHGVPSQKVWKKYLSWQENRHGKCVAVDFRNKADFGWADHVETLRFLSGKKVNSRVFTNIFYSHKALRPSCYECKYKTVMHPGDITIADYWEIDRAFPGFNDNKGVSLVMINNDHGMDVFNTIKHMIEWKETSYKDSIRPSMFKSANRPNDREQFWKDFNNREFGYIANKYGGNSIMYKFKKKVKRLLPVLVK